MNIKVTQFVKQCVCVSDDEYIDEDYIGIYVMKWSNVK